MSLMLKLPELGNTGRLKAIISFDRSGRIREANVPTVSPGGKAPPCHANE
jgi:hypothetical protein